MNQGTISRGIRCPIIKKGDDLVEVVTTSLKKVVVEDGVKLDDKDVVCVTEAVLGRSQGNYASLEQIGKDVSNKYGQETIGLVLHILSRNRFSNILKGISKGSHKLIIQLSYPDDEVGNKLISLKEMYSKHVTLDK